MRICARLASSLSIAWALCSALPGRAAAQPYGVPDTSEFRIRNLEMVNTESDDYGPYVTANGQWLYLTNNHLGSANLYRSRRGEDWSAPENPNVDLNTNKDEGSFSAPAARHGLLFELSSDDLAKLDYAREGVITASDRSDGLGDADLEMIEILPNGADLGATRKLHELNSGDWDAQATLSPDGSMIVFSSNRDGGSGGMDLYIATRQTDGSFSRPENLGSVVNTSGNEFSPFLSPDGRTLFFSSTGHGGLGGADIFSTSRNAAGTWTAPKNLGDRINTSSNELFFFGVDRQRCYFVSDRPGGKGRLDIYEGGPNIFISGYSSIHVTLLDTSTGRKLPGEVTITEVQLDRKIGQRDIVTATGATFLVLDGLAYRVDGISPGYEPATATVSDVAPGATVQVTLTFGSPPLAAELEPPPPIEQPPIPAPPEPPMPPVPVVYTFNVDGKIVPFFVSGYYRLNTQPSLAELRRRQASDLKMQTYITDVKGDRAAFDQNRKFASEVEKLLADFVEMCETVYFPDFIKYLERKAPTDPKEFIQLTVYGFADPRPIIGAYSEDPVTFLDSTGQEVTVRSWERLDNFKLGGLRAYYSVEYFDKLFRRGRARKQYLSLMQKGLIRWRAVSGSVDDLNALTSGEELGTKRRIVVDARLVGADGKPVQQ